MEREALLGNIKDDLALAAYKAFMHFNAISNTVMFVVVVWLLLTKTPDSMRTYRWYLLNMSVGNSRKDYSSSQ
ncbi:hypothetical protein AAVH_15814 [Aphelenchoides avenae]|nr:hypothetical protein AAVH_15814 [Aphelenchus avenae]